MIGHYSQLTMYGYGFAAIAQLSLFVLFVFKYRRRSISSLIAVAALVSAVWAALIAQQAQLIRLSGLQVFIVEIAHHFFWLVFLSALIRGGVPSRRNSWIGYSGVVVGLVILAAGLTLEMLQRFGIATGGAVRILNVGAMLLSVLVLVLIEQIYRNARHSQRRSLKYLCIGLGSLFAYDVVMYSNAVLVGAVDELTLAARGFVVAMCAPLVAISAVRAKTLSSEVFVSRQIVFYTTTLFGSGLYLAIVAVLAFYIRQFGGDWGKAAQFLFSVAATILLFVILISDSVRRKLRVFVNKHFFENRYDYRNELLRLMDTLAATEDQLVLSKRSIKALAQIVESDAGQLWLLQDNSDGMYCDAGWNAPAQRESLPADAAVLKFLDAKRWIIEFSEYQGEPGRYGDIDIGADVFEMSNPGYLIPLAHENRLIGFVLLNAGGRSGRLDYEDRDLLNTAATLVAIQLVQDEASEHLSEARQFEAYHRFTAFIMHDLKNLIAQQSLVVENARTHKSNPEFVDDMVATIKSGVARMRSLLDNLQHGFAKHHVEHVELGKLVMRAASQCADRTPLPQAKIGESEVWVNADKERLLMALTHGIRNSQEACDAEGSVVIHVDRHDGKPIVRITDNGSGMSGPFIKDRLFKPFDSTKGTSGMGIGAYQIRETLRAIGGDVTVKSEPDVGTEVVLWFGPSSGE